jgi:hypothetical protein
MCFGHLAKLAVKSYTLRCESIGKVPPKDSHLRAGARKTEVNPSTWQRRKQMLQVAFVGVSESDLDGRQMVTGFKCRRRSTLVERSVDSPDTLSMDGGVRKAKLFCLQSVAVLSIRTRLWQAQCNISRCGMVSDA